MTTATVTAPAQERRGVVTFKGNPLTLIGPGIKFGTKAPEFQVLAQDLTPVTLSMFKGKTLLISVTPSVDTPVCDAQVRRFNQEAATLPNVEILNVSMDLPFALKRWCGAAGVDKVKAVSDHRDVSFGRAYGMLIKELRLLTRAIIIVGGDGTVRYVEYVPEVTAHPNYDSALQAIRRIAQ